MMSKHDDGRVNISFDSRHGMTPFMTVKHDKTIDIYNVSPLAGGKLMNTKNLQDRHDFYFMVDFIVACLKPQ